MAIQFKETIFSEQMFKTFKEIERLATVTQSGDSQITISTTYMDGIVNFTADAAFLYYRMKVNGEHEFFIGTTRKFNRDDLMRFVRCVKNFSSSLNKLQTVFGIMTTQL